MWLLIFDQLGMARNVRTMRISDGTIVHTISSVVFPWLYTARRPGFWRYITRNATNNTVTSTNTAPVM
jgi:hypothetical protein